MKVSQFIAAILLLAVVQALNVHIQTESPIHGEEEHAFLEK